MDNNLCYKDEYFEKLLESDEPYCTNYGNK